MPIGPAGASGGAFVGLGPAQNQFGTAATADQAAAEALRDAYATANATWLAEYDGNLSYLIRLVWTSGGQAFQRRNVAGTDWEDVTTVVPGLRGLPGSDATVTAAVVNPIIAAYDGGMPNLDLVAAQIPSLPAGRVDSGQFDPARIPNLSADKITSGAFTRPRIPDLDASTITSGVLSPLRIPTMFVTATQMAAAFVSMVKAFALTGGRGVQVGDMDAESSTIDQVPTSNGQGGVAWEDQKGYVRQMFVRWIGLSADGAFTATEFTVFGETEGLAVPAIGQNEMRHIGFARPASLGNFTYVYIYAPGARDTQNRINAWTQQTDLITLNGIPQAVLFSNTAADSSMSGMIVEAG